MLRPAARATGHVVDVRSREELESLRARLEREGTALDIIIPNAGINVRTPLMQIAPGQIDDIIDTNLKGVISTLQVFAPMIFNRPQARVVINSSCSAIHGMVLRAVYTATKAGLSGLVRSLAFEWGPQGVTVNAVGPGIIRTALITAYIDQHPGARRGGAEEHAAGAHRHAGGGGRCGAVPRLACGALRHRADPLRRRRAHRRQQLVVRQQRRER